MFNPQLVLHEKEYEAIKIVCDRLYKESNSKIVFIVDKNGQLIAVSGDVSRMDTTSLASLTAGNVAATGGLAKILGEKEFSVLFHEGENDSVHISLIGTRMILVVIFDKRTNQGLVRLKVKKTTEELNRIFDAIYAKTEKEKDSQSAIEITEGDIDKLFGDF